MRIDNAADGNPAAVKLIVASTADPLTDTQGIMHIIPRGAACVRVKLERLARNDCEAARRNALMMEPLWLGKQQSQRNLSRTGNARRRQCERCYTVDASHLTRHKISYRARERALIAISMWKSR